jgi:hypothetical protein
MTTVLSLAGSLSFNPLTDSIPTPSGKPFKFAAPDGDELPKKGFNPGEETFQAPPSDSSALTVVVSPKSQRLQLLAVRAREGGGVVDALPSPSHTHSLPHSSLSCTHLGRSAGLGWQRFHIALGTTKACTPGFLPPPFLTCPALFLLLPHLFCTSPSPLGMARTLLTAPC